VGCWYVGSGMGFGIVFGCVGRIWFVEWFGSVGSGVQWGLGRD